MKSKNVDNPQTDDSSPYKKSKIVDTTHDEGLGVDVLRILSNSGFGESNELENPSLKKRYRATSKQPG